MKIAIQCKSPLLQKSLELFLEKYLTNESRCNILIRDVACLDDKRCFYIATDEKADLRKPFSKAELILSLEKRLNLLEPKQENLLMQEMGFEILEKRIELLTQEYQKKIIQTVKAFYEK